MHIKYALICIFFKYCVINAAIIVWSNKKVEISPLLPFDDEDFENLVKKLDVNKVYVFKVGLKSRNAVIPKNLKEVIDPFYSSYNPNGNIGTSKAIELSLSEDCNGIETSKIRKTTGVLSNSTNFLCVLDITYPRKKRETDDDGVEREPRKNFVPQGPVIYIGQTKKNQSALLYSSKPLKLEVNHNTKYLGNTDNSLITVDNRLNIPIPLEKKGNKVILRFGISLISGYWYLQTAKVELVGKSTNDSFNFDLSTEENIMAPAHFSYHCNGQSIFYDPTSGTKLTIYDLQVQIDAKQERFGDANDCVPFTTAPIWSGLFVTSILGLGLIVAVTAILDIKTMDKFDVPNTKNLYINVME
ncbi:unnamed protein product [Ceutorhynchus assimilis]|uniref:Vacuolar ATP synthase subunit S1 n=1 Tax=Ceutorhynchus assimilis TaxID=467358 RepID=A0A9N9MHQ1_9CUCU|nr:unnamed protein product [Ceutorhynchus assimilis]